MLKIKYWGNSVNDFGNLSIAGHNNYDGTMFGKTKKLKIGDIVELTDLNSLLEAESTKFISKASSLTKVFFILSPKYHHRRQF